MKRLYITSVLVLAVAFVLVGATALAYQPQNAQTTASPQWKMDFYPNLDWAGYPVYTLFSPHLNYNWGTAAPGPNLPADNWTMRATLNNVYLYEGVYQFNILADDEFVFMIDDVIYMSTVDQGLSGKEVAFAVSVSQGYHTVRVDFREYTGAAYFLSSWSYQKTGAAPIPPSDRPLPAPLPPDSADSVQTKYGDFTPCIEQGLHQSKCFHSDGAWDSPNVGSIELEPAITIWGACEPADSDVVWTVDTTTDPMTTHTFRCSKTLAGWFPH
ncbi:MAG: hypothetical protein GXP42_06195 [Chloroflexi bacterium]|nr:hypothetical protein [Chloroflexota bacterium]